MASLERNRHDEQYDDRATAKPKPTGSVRDERLRRERFGERLGQHERVGQHERLRQLGFGQYERLRQRFRADPLIVSQRFLRRL
jgi:hypothetical protein